MKIEKVKKEIFELYKIIADFQKYSGNFPKIRPDMKCFSCNRKFELGDNINLGFFRKSINRPICNSCTRDIRENHKEVELIIRKSK